MQKQVKKIANLKFQQNAPGFKTINMMHSEYGIEPFLVFTEFHMSRPVFGPHAHAGVSVMTYMRPKSDGSFINRDSLGENVIIEPGGMHVTQAGKGVKHDEVPQKTDIDCNGFQIWINHSSLNRMVEPQAFHAKKIEIETFQNDLVDIRVLQGNFQGVKAPFELLTKTQLFDVTLKANASIDLESDEMTFIYLMDGELLIDGSTLEAPAIVTFKTEGDFIRVNSGNKLANFMFGSGKPHKEAIIHGGPFVMTTQKQMIETQRRFQNGEMGVLE